MTMQKTKDQRIFRIRIIGPRMPSVLKEKIKHVFEHTKLISKKK